MRKLRIHFVGLKGIPATYGGVERAVEEIGARLAARGHEVTVHCRAHYTPANLATHRGMRILRERTLHTKRLDTLSHAAIGIYRACCERPDVIGLHNYPNGPLAWLARAARVPVVLHLHGFEWGLDKWNQLDKLLLRLVLGPAMRAPNALTSVSAVQAAWIRQRTGREVRHVPNGVCAPDWIGRGEKRPDGLAGMGLESGGYILVVGRLVPQKGVEHLIRAFRRSRTRLPLVIVGDHNHAPAYAAMLREEAGGDSRVRFLGYRFGDELWALYAHCALFVLPSESEGMPLVLLEAMAARSPILASDLPEIQDVGGSSLAYFRSGDVADLTTKLESWLEDPAGRRELAESAARRVRGRYTWELAADAFEELYNRLAGGRDGAVPATAGESEARRNSPSREASGGRG